MFPDAVRIFPHGYCRQIVLKNISARHRIRVNMARPTHSVVGVLASIVPTTCWRTLGRSDMVSTQAIFARKTMSNDSVPEPLPVVVLIGTGGTIASVAGSETQLSDYAVSAGVDSLIQAVPALGALARFEFEQVCNIESHAIDDALLLRIAHRVNAWLARPEITAVVVTHGTDTLEETAYFLNLVVKSSKPVVVVGAMRPASALSADGPLNLFHAVSVAVSPDSSGKGVLVVMNDRIVAARYAAKGHTTNVDAFVVPEQGCLGVVSGTNVQYFNASARRHTTNSEFQIDETLSSLPMVDIIYDHQGAGSHLYAASIQAGARGIVLAATGNGSLSPSATEGVRMATEHGIAFVRASRVWQGSVRPSVRDPELGLVAAQSLSPQKARVLLRLALLIPKDRQTLQRVFDTY